MTSMNSKIRVTQKLFVRSVLALGAAVLVISCSTEPVDVSTLKGGEMRATLSPALFTGRAAMAYRAAKEIPGVLDHMYCYCECKKNFGHKSLLTCHVDNHSKFCNVCMDEATMAHRMHKDGKSVAEIRGAIDSKYKGLL